MDGRVGAVGEQVGEMGERGRFVDGVRWGCEDGLWTPGWVCGWAGGRLSEVGTGCRQRTQALNLRGG